MNNPTEIVGLMMYVFHSTGLLPIIQVLGVGLVAVAIFRAFIGRD